MAQSFYTKWQYVFLADAGCYVSREYRNFQTALVREISKYAKAVDAAVVAKTKGHLLYELFCRAQRQIRLHKPFLRIVPEDWLGQNRTRFVPDPHGPACRGLYRRHQSILRSVAVAVHDRPTAGLTLLPVPARQAVTADRRAGSGLCTSRSPSLFSLVAILLYSAQKPRIVEKRQKQPVFALEKRQEGPASRPTASCTVVDTDSPYRPFFPAGQETPSPVLSDRLGHNIFQQERDHAHIHDAILIRPRLAVAVQHDDLAEEVAGVSQREGFLCLLFRRVYV